TTPGPVTAFNPLPTTTGPVAMRRESTPDTSRLFVPTPDVGPTLRPSTVTRAPSRTLTVPLLMVKVPALRVEPAPVTVSRGGVAWLKPTTPTVRTPATVVAAPSAIVHEAFEAEPEPSVAKAPKSRREPAPLTCRSRVDAPRPSDPELPIW